MFPVSNDTGNKLRKISFAVTAVHHVTAVLKKTNEITKYSKKKP